VAERRRHSNNGEAPVAGDEVPAVLQLMCGAHQGSLMVTLQRGTMAARAELTERMGRRRRGGQNPAAQGISGGSEWTKGRGEKGRDPGGAGVEGGKRTRARRRDRFIPMCGDGGWSTG
jgi:hypothetical protein